MDSYAFGPDLRVSKRDLSILFVLREVPFLPVDFIKTVFRFSSCDVYGRLKYLREKGLVNQFDWSLDRKHSSLYRLGDVGSTLVELAAINPKSIFKNAAEFDWRSYLPCQDFDFMKFSDSWVRTNYQLSFSHLLELWIRVRHTGAFQNVVLPMMVSKLKRTMYGPPDIVCYSNMKNEKLRGWVAIDWEYCQISKQRAWEKINLAMKNPSFDWQLFLAPSIKVLKVFAQVVRLSMIGKYKDQAGKLREFESPNWKEILTNKVFFGTWMPSGLANIEAALLSSVMLHRFDHEIFDPLIWDKDHRVWKASGYDGRAGGVNQYHLLDIFGAYANRKESE